MKRIFAAGAFALANPAMAAAQESPAGQTFDIVQGEASWSVVFHEDGLYESEASGQGEWSFQDGVLCLSGLTETGEAEEPRCAEWTELEVGESAVTTAWSDDGAEMTITRVE